MPTVEIVGRWDAVQCIARCPVQSLVEIEKREKGYGELLTAVKVSVVTAK